MIKQHIFVKLAVPEVNGKPSDEFQLVQHHHYYMLQRLKKPVAILNFFIIVLLNLELMNYGLLSKKQNTVDQLIRSNT
jgi:hypothetical protein